MPIGKIIVVCEAEGDARVAKGFSERVVSEKITWFEDLPEPRLEWCGVSRTALFCVGQALPIDPCQEQHKLRGTKGEPRCAKDIWETLSDGDVARETPCWQQTSLETLKARGEDCLLTAFLQEVEQILLPALAKS